MAENNGERGQVIQSVAEIYESLFVPALFQQWSPILVDMMDIQKDSNVLDIACGTGILACHAANLVSDKNSVYGVDIKDGMLTVAREVAPDIQWRNNAAEELPSEDNGFNAVGSQIGIMFFENRRIAIAEMLRVLKPNGKLAIAVWDSLEMTPGYAAVVSLFHRLFGESIAKEIRAPFNLGEIENFAALFESAEAKNVDFVSHEGLAQFNSIDEWMYTDIQGWTLAGKLDDSQFEILLTEAKKELKMFVDKSASVTFAAPAILLF